MKKQFVLSAAVTALVTITTVSAGFAGGITCPPAKAEPPAIAMAGPYQTFGFGTSEAKVVFLPTCESAQKHLNLLIQAVPQGQVTLNKIIAEENGTYTARVMRQ